MEFFKTILLTAAAGVYGYVLQFHWLYLPMSTYWDLIVCIGVRSDVDYLVYEDSISYSIKQIA